MIAVERLIDLSVEQNIVPDAKFHYLWDEHSRWQFETLRQLGLEPGSFLLDIGCGPLRLGQRAIPFLHPGHYFGVEPFRPYIALGQRVLAELEIRTPYRVLESDTFDFETFGVRFDFAMAQSVWTHLSQPQIRACMTQLRAVMKPGGRLVFTYLLDRVQTGVLYFGRHPMIRPGLVSDRLFRDLAAELGVTFSQPLQTHRSQRVGLFTF